ncbi:hypothetical protein PybrP1_008932 [[Pythium] brassicae (nom. inval.)]|nr:hypothetical protein PybrP1_008932 [[Pythium] brassicae (nom. inval.)]
MGRKRSASEFEKEHEEHQAPAQPATVTVAVEEEEEAAAAATPAHSIGEEERESAQDADYEPYRKTLVEGEPGTLSGRPLRLYADGIFDLFHFGHAKALQQCKEAYPNVVLIVGCCGDEVTHKLKGRTVMTDKERYESLRHCRWVDEVVEDAPWVITDDFLEQHAIDYVCHDALPYSDASGEAAEGDVYARIKAMGKFLETKRTDGISTSDLIIRIVAEYDTFIRRNLARGYTGKDMNVPFMKEQSIKFDMAVDKVKHDVDGFFHRLVGKAEDIQTGFLDLFRREGTLRSSFREQRQQIRRRLSMSNPETSGSASAAAAAEHAAGRQSL